MPSIFRLLCATFIFCTIVSFCNAEETVNREYLDDELYHSLKRRSPGGRPPVNPEPPQRHRPEKPRPTRRPRPSMVQTTPPPPAAGKQTRNIDEVDWSKMIRLVNGDRDNIGRVEIRAEVKPGKLKWGKVCHDKWGQNDADVACRQLGFTRGAKTAIKNAERYFGAGKNNFLMDDVECTGTEDALQQCTFGKKANNKFGRGNCKDKTVRVAGIECRPNQVTGCAEVWMMTCANEKLAFETYMCSSFYF